MNTVPCPKWKRWKWQPGVLPITRSLAEKKSNKWNHATRDEIDTLPCPNHLPVRLLPLLGSTKLKFVWIIEDDHDRWFLVVTTTTNERSKSHGIEQSLSQQQLLQPQQNSTTPRSQPPLSESNLQRIEEAFCERAPIDEAALIANLPAAMQDDDDEDTDIMEL